MEKTNIFRTLLLLAVFGVTAYASGPLLQISDYSTVPETLYPGTNGYLLVSLSNTGDATAQSVTAYYDVNGIEKTVSIGDVSGGSSAKVSIPIRISVTSTGGIQLVDVDMYYSYSSNSSTPSRRTSLSVPLTIQQYAPIEARIASMGRSAIAPGEKLALQIELTNTGGIVNNLVITTAENSSFSIDGSTQKSVGSIPYNSSVNVTLTLASSSSTSAGSYNIPLTLTYQDALMQPTEQVLSIGPLSVLESSSQYRVYLTPLTPVEVGSQAVFRLTVVNLGSSPLSGVIDITATDAFTPIGLQRTYLDAIPAGSNVSMNVTIGVNSSKSAGYYLLPLKLSPNGGVPSTFSAGIAVDATPQITVTVDSSSGTTQVQIANTGNTQVHSVYAIAKFTGASTSSESFIGTLNIDDYATLSLTSTGPAQGIDVEIRFRDSTNAEHVVKQTIEAKSAVFTGTAGGTGASGMPGFNGTRGARNGGGLFGFLPGATTSNPMSLVPYAIGILVVGAVGYFGYKRWKGRKAK